MELRVLDLFSGIGGFSYALSSIATTIAYCDIDPNCRNLLQSNMNKGLIHNAPIFTDVKKIKQSDIIHLNPNTITAGFPCQDISVANPDGKGIYGKKSGLFSEIVRIVDENKSIQIVFMENSSHIIDAGFKKIKRTMENRGFIVKHVLIRASDVGAYHKRLRWYCLCYKPESHNLLNPINKKYLDFNWSNCMKIQKLIKYKSKEHKIEQIIRCMMLGNSIVPQCAIYAWNLMITGNRDAPKREKDLHLVFTDGDKTIIKTQWATPVYSIWHNYRSLTDRGSRLLSNQTFYYQKSIVKCEEKKLCYNKYGANPIFVESLMGYPRGWTSL